jgi:hypothetical protein
VSLTSEFFIEIDRLWPRQPAGKVQLSIIGSGALMLQVDYERGTKDSDVFETTALTDDTKQRLIAVGGPGPTCTGAGTCTSTSCPAACRFFRMSRCGTQCQP